MRLKYTFCTLVLAISQVATAQQLHLKSGVYSFESLEQAPPLPHESEILDGKYFRILLFNNLPNQAEKDELNEGGIQLLEYLPKQAFIASIERDADFTSFNHLIKKVVAMDPQFKLSEMLARGEFPHWAFYGENEIEIIAKYYSSLSLKMVTQELSNAGFQTLSYQEDQQLISLRLPINKLEGLYEMGCFQYFETIAPPGEPENLPGRTAHRSNTLWTSYQGGLSYRGDGIKVMMQDDGYIGDHIDYTGRIDQSGCNPCSTADADNHGDHVAGTIMGAGNLDPKTRGMAHGVDLLVYNSSNANYNAVPNLYNNEDVHITSKSYSDNCNGGYTTLARQLDQQVRQLPTLSHVFSAGNSGSDDCGYGAGAGWGNITGGHKSGKNVIAVGNLTSTDALNSSSSRGPATDGRIKPDICGVGTSVNSTISDNTYASFTGTSMSCPGVAGTIAQLYEAYKDMHGGEYPDAALIKGSIMNCADDLGNPGPDFRFGWGRINALRTFDLLDNQLYILDSVSQGEQRTHTIDVPAGTNNLRLMVYWTDFEGAANASIALVNDINMSLSDPGAVNYLPWVLDHSPSALALNSTAVPGIDDLNNVEQVVIPNPVPGTYTVNIDGFAIPAGPQRYYVLYYFEKEIITVTYPIGGEGLKPASNELIRWDASAGTDPFTISFSADNGSSWNQIGTASASLRHFSWNIPAGTFTGQGRIRVERNSLSGMSAAEFSVIDIPNNLEVEWACPDSLKLVWDSVDDAISYEVSMLGNKYMDSIGTSTSTSLVIPVPASGDNWFSVKAIGPDNAIGERAIAIRKTPGEFGCIWSAPYAAFDIDCDVAGEAYCFTLFDESVNTDASANLTWYFPGGTPAVSTDLNPQVCYDSPGLYDVALVVDNGVAIDSVYQTAYIEVDPTSELPYFEGFETHSSFSNNPYWSTSNPDGNAAFLPTTLAALSGSKSARLNNFSQNGAYVDELISGPIDLSVLESNDDVTLSFRYAYRKRSTENSEALKVFITKSCANEWVQRKTIQGSQLSALTQSSSWTPSSPSDWTTVHMTNVTSSYFTSDFRLKFRFESDGGNNLYIDNINLYEGGPSDDLILGISEESVSEFLIFPNPTEGELNIQFAQSQASPVSVVIQELSGKVIFDRALESQAGTNIVVIDANGFASGMYLISLIEGSSTVTKRVVIK
jgi:hypothetical protein